MKKKNAVPLAPIICRLTNVDERYDANALIFSLVNILIAKQHPFVVDYFKYLNYYTPVQYAHFSIRISEKRNKSVQVNQQHFIIFYSILHFTIQLYQSKNIIDFIQAELPTEASEGIEETGKMLKEYCEDVLTELKKEYKKNHALTLAFAKIEAYKIADDKYEVVDNR